MIGYIVGVALLVHAGYSAHEYRSLAADMPFPPDVALESIVALLLINANALYSIRNKPRMGVTHNQEVRPDLEYLLPIGFSEALTLVNKLGVTEMETLDTRVDFMNVTEKRKEVAEWVLKQRTE